MITIQNDFDLFDAHFIFNKACQKEPLKMELMHMIKLYTSYFSFNLVFKNFNVYHCKFVSKNLVLPGVHHTISKNITVKEIYSGKLIL